MTNKDTMNVKSKHSPKYDFRTNAVGLANFHQEGSTSTTHPTTVPPKSDFRLRHPVYQISFQQEASGKRVAATKRRVKFNFGFPNREAIKLGHSGPNCRGEEHEIVLVWSLTSGKRSVLMDGQEVHFSAGKLENVFETSSPMAGGHLFKIVAHATPPLFDKPGFRQFDLFIDGQSFFEMPRIFELGATSIEPLPEPTPVTPNNFSSRSTMNVTKTAPDLLSSFYDSSLERNFSMPDLGSHSFDQSDSGASAPTSATREIPTLERNHSSQLSPTQTMGFQQHVNPQISWTPVQGASVFKPLSSGSKVAAVPISPATTPTMTTYYGGAAAFGNHYGAPVNPEIVRPATFNNSHLGGHPNNMTIASLPLPSWAPSSESALVIHSTNTNNSFPNPFAPPPPFAPYTATTTLQRASNSMVTMGKPNGGTGTMSDMSTTASFSGFPQRPVIASTMSDLSTTASYPGFSQRPEITSSLSSSSFASLPSPYVAY